MRRIVIFLVALTSSIAIPTCGRGDMILYRVPGSDLVLKLQGTTKSLSGRVLSYTHPKYGNVFFALEDTKVYKVTSLQILFRRRLNRAKSSKDANQAIEVANWALHHGMIKDHYDAVALALELDPKNEVALGILDLRRRMEQTIPINPALEKKLRDEVHPLSFKVERSDHFILLHDTPDMPTGKRRRTRAEARLQLLETVYQSFLLQFYSKGVPLDIPDERLMVLLFNEHEAFQKYAKDLSPTLIHASGFWSPKTNISVFFDHGTASHFEGLRELSRQLKQEASEAVLRRRTNRRNIVYRSQAIALLVKVTQESSDIEVVSHEATHQMAGNTGLFPRDVRIPRWVHEGLAAYFESPNDAAWAGMGAVNKQRLDWYRALAEDDRKRPGIDLIVGDQIFDSSGEDHKNVLHAYGQAWALTHFLMEQHFKELMEYYSRLGDFPPDTPIPQDLLNELFEEVFGKDRKELEKAWRESMKTLKTDFERIVGAAEGEGEGEGE